MSTIIEDRLSPTIPHIDLDAKVVVVPYFHFRGLSYVVAVESATKAGAFRLTLPQAPSFDAAGALVQQTGLVAQPFLAKEIYAGQSMDRQVSVMAAYVEVSNDYSFTNAEGGRARILEPGKAASALSDVLSLVAVSIAKQKSLLPDFY